MNDLELRNQFEQWAAPLRTSPAPAMPELRRRARRRTVRIAATSAAAICAVAALVGIALATMPRATGPQPTSAARGMRAIFGTGPYPAPKAAPFEVVYGRGGSSARVIDAASGTTLHTVGAVGMFTAIAATPGDRLFILAQQDAQDQTSFDILRIGPRITRLSPVLTDVTLPRGNQIYGMTVNPQGTRLALNTIAAGGLGPMHLYVYDLTTSALLGNFSESAGPVDLQYWPSADRLAFGWEATGHATGANGLRILDTSTAAAGHTSAALIADSAPDRTAFRYDAGDFTSDGTVAIDVTQDRRSVLVREFATASGLPLHTFTIGTTQARDQSASYCGVLWASANGTDLLTQCGDVQQEVVNGRAVRTKLAVNVLASQVGWADSFAW